jgi:hypothetical protein
MFFNRSRKMRFVAIVLSVIGLIWVGTILVSDLRNFYFGEALFYFFICLCFIINLIALKRSRPKSRCKEKPAEAE